MRVDLSDELPTRVEHLADVAAAGGPDAAIAVIVDDDGATAGCATTNTASWPRR